MILTNGQKESATQHLVDLIIWDLFQIIFSRGLFPPGNNQSIGIKRVAPPVDCGFVTILGMFPFFGLDMIFLSDRVFELSNKNVCARQMQSKYGYHWQISLIYKLENPKARVALLKLENPICVG